MKSTKFEKMFGYGGVKGVVKDVKEGLTSKTSTWDKIKSGLVNAREKKRKLVKEINWVQDFVGDSGTQMTNRLAGTPNKAKMKTKLPRNERYISRYSKNYNR